MQIGPSANVLQALGSSPSTPEPVRIRPDLAAPPADVREVQAQQAVERGASTQAVRPAEAGPETSGDPRQAPRSRVDILV